MAEEKPEGAAAWRNVSCFRSAKWPGCIHVSVGTLRHYEQAGLLKPEYTDPATGYRYYSVRQLEQLTSIRYLRALDMPLQEIAVYMNDRDVDNVAAAESADRPEETGTGTDRTQDRPSADTAGRGTQGGK